MTKEVEGAVITTGKPAEAEAAPAVEVNEVKSRAAVIADLRKNGAEVTTSTIQDVTYREDKQGREQICFTLAVPVPSYVADEAGVFIKGISKWTFEYPSVVRALLNEDKDVVGLAKAIMATNDRARLILGGATVKYISEEVDKDVVYVNPFTGKANESAYGHDTVVNHLVELTLSARGKKFLDKLIDKILG